MSVLKVVTLVYNGLPFISIYPILKAFPNLCMFIPQYFELKAFAEQLDK